MPQDGLHEAREQLDASVIDRHRALASICEELEAVDWYDQRVAATDEAELRAILEHNRDEEKEHAAMLIEWLRRRDTNFDVHLRRFLFGRGPILESEAKGTEESEDGSLGIGKPELSRGEVR
jgi:ferritin-like protein